VTEEEFTRNMEAAERTLYHIACAKLPNFHDREDAMMETVARCWEKRNTLRNPEYFTTWAVRILLNVIHDINRENSKRLSPADMPDPWYRETGYEDAELAELLNTLSEDQRLVTVLYYVDNLSTRDIARALRIPEGTVRYRLHRARKILKLELDSGKEGLQ